VRGQAAARRSLEIAAAGGHNLLLHGPPGSGKTMLARRLPSCCPLSGGALGPSPCIRRPAGGRRALARARSGPHHTASVPPGGRLAARRRGEPRPAGPVPGRLPGFPATCRSSPWRSGGCVPAAEPHQLPARFAGRRQAPARAARSGPGGCRCTAQVLSCGPNLGPSWTDRPAGGVRPSATEGRRTPGEPCTSSPGRPGLGPPAGQGPGERSGRRQRRPRRRLRLPLRPRGRGLLRAIQRGSRPGATTVCSGSRGPSRTWRASPG
jgi:hypothetical protein